MGYKLANAPGDAFRAARDYLIEHRMGQDQVAREFHWPQLTEFNWALDHFDRTARERPDAHALWIIHEDSTEERLSYGQMAARSNRAANWLRSQGVKRGDRVLVMLGNVSQLWEVLLASFKLGAVVIPASTLLTAADLLDRIERGRVSFVVAAEGDAGKFDAAGTAYKAACVGGEPEGWINYDESGRHSDSFEPDGPTHATDPLLLYFTSGTTHQPKLVTHTHQSYPVGHLSTMFWIGLQPDDIHMNISSPGWAKHAWSCVFAPWNAGACVFVHNVARFSAGTLLEVIARSRVTTLCAPPTVWRMLIREDLGAWRHKLALREVVGAGEPLNPEIIEQVRKNWGLILRDGYGQTETTAMIGNGPGLTVKPSSMGRPLPGYRIALLDSNDEESDEGEICIKLSDTGACGSGGFGVDGPPLGLMAGYADSAERTAEAMSGGYYRTGDVGRRDGDGYYTYVGRADDVFKASDYRISPFELESRLIEHAAVVEAAVIPSPDPVRLAVPKGCVILAAGYPASAETALDILQFVRSALAPYKRIRRIEFVRELPKTISGKIRRVELRDVEKRRRAGGTREVTEFFEEDFPQLGRPS